VTTGKAKINFRARNFDNIIKKTVLNPYFLSILSIFTSMPSLAQEDINNFILQENEIQRQIVLVKLGKNEDAIRDLNKLINDGKKNAVIYHYLARAYEATNRLDQGIKFFEKSIETDSSYPKPYLGLALAKGQQGNMKETLELLNKAIKLNPKYAEAYSNRGVTKGALNDNYGALDDFNEAIKLNPLLPDPYINRGITRELIGDLISACEDWQIASSLGEKKAQEWHSNQCKDTQTAQIIRQNKLIESLEKENKELSQKLISNDQIYSNNLNANITAEYSKQSPIEKEQSSFNYYYFIVIFLISAAFAYYYFYSNNLIKPDNSSVKKEIFKEINIPKTKNEKSIFIKLLDKFIKYFNTTLRSVQKIFNKLKNIFSYSIAKI